MADDNAPPPTNFQPGGQPGHAGPPSRDPWSKLEIISVVAGVTIGLIVAIFGGLYTLYSTISAPIEALEDKVTDVQVDIATINQHLKSIDQTLASGDDRLKEFDRWRVDHLDAHPVSRTPKDDAPAD